MFTDEWGQPIAVGVFPPGFGALTALSKSKNHFVGLTWASGDQRGGFGDAVRQKRSRHPWGIGSGKKAVDTDALTVKN